MSTTIRYAKIADACITSARIAQLSLEEQTDIYHAARDNELAAGQYRSSLGRPMRSNCRNCGAPPEPRCSYCGTTS